MTNRLWLRSFWLLQKSVHSKIYSLINLWLCIQNFDLYCRKGLNRGVVKLLPFREYEKSEYVDFTIIPSIFMESLIFIKAQY